MGVAVPTWVTLPVISRACAANAASGAIARKRESDTANRRRTDAPRRDREMVGVFGRQIRRVLRPPKTIVVTAIPLTPAWQFNPAAGRYVTRICSMYPAAEPLVKRDVSAFVPCT